MTSLAKQLQKLAIPGQPSLRQVVSKKRPSLLFDPEAAADIDTDTILSLGLNGLEELISIDQSFVQFEATIFQESYKEFERTVQTKEVLEDIDSQISAFLRNVSPYLLLRPAQKCLEWLICSFRINSFNVDPLMECVLPYHETNLFARVLQLVPIKDPASPWHWLRPSQKAGSPLSKLTLTQHCISVPSFLVFLCEIVTRSLKALRPSSSSTNRALLGMYTSTVIGLMGEPGSVTEDLISRLLPYLIKGLKSSNNDFRASSYMIVSQLAARSSLESSLCSSLLEVIAKVSCYEDKRVIVKLLYSLVNVAIVVRVKCFYSIWDQTFCLRASAVLQWYATHNRCNTSVRGGWACCTLILNNHPKGCQTSLHEVRCCSD